MQEAASGRVKAGDWLRLTAEREPQRTFVIDQGTDSRYTFGEANARVNQLANALIGMGIERGDRIAILATDSHRYIETVLASLKIGAIFAPLNFRLTPKEAVTLVARSEASVLFYSAEYEVAASRVRDDCPTIYRTVQYDNRTDEATSYEALLGASTDSEPMDIEVSGNDIVAIGFTSGTTGLPKAVLQNDRTLQEYALRYRLTRNLRENEVFYVGIPMYHIAGITGLLCSTYSAGTHIVSPQFDARKTVECLATVASATLLVPTMISSLLAQPGVEDRNFDNLRTILYGGAPMSPSLLRKALQVFGCDFVQLFAAGTEGGGSTVLTPDDHSKALGGMEHLLKSVGRPEINVALKIRDSEWKEVGPGEIGEVTTKSEGLMSGYLDMPVETAEAVRNGWFSAGDVGYVDDEGYLFLVGREKDVIIRGGENIYPIEIESTIESHPLVREAAVVGVSDEHWGEIVKAFVVRTGEDPSGVTEADLKAHCRQYLSGFKVPELWEFTDELPRNASGKVLKRLLQE